MSSRRFQWFMLGPVFLLWMTVPPSRAQGARQLVPETPIAERDSDHVRERSAWFLRGRLIPNQSAAELRRRAYETKMRIRVQRAAAQRAMSSEATNAAIPATSGAWMPLGPAPLASDASGTGLVDYGPVSGRASAVAIDPADPSGNTVYVAGAQGGIWKSTNAANSNASSVTWSPIADDQATLSIGALAIQPNNTDPTKTTILAGTGEANNSADSYFGLGILRSADAGNTWTLIRSANSGALSFSGLGGTRMAFGSPTVVVASMATTSEGLVAGAVTSNTTRGLYTSRDAGQTWTYDAISDPGNAPTDATSATSVVYNASAGLFFAAIRYHGFYSSPDGTHWTRLAVQPGSRLSTTACPAQSISNNYSCPIYRGEISVVPGRNEMYVWFIYLDAYGNPQDGGIWQSLNGGASWTAINESGITNCGDVYGCGVAQGYYNLAILATSNGAATDLYAGAVNLYKCTITTNNPACNTNPFMNLTHAYGCNPISAPAHVHPDQHALDFIIPTLGTDSGNVLMFFANDGGLYRALNAVSGLNTGSCSGANQFDNLNQNLGSMTQIVSFSQHPTDPDTMLAGSQDNGSPASSSATTSRSWINVNGGDGGFNAIDPTAATSWFVTNPDIPPNGLAIQQCSEGVNCRQSAFSPVITSADLGGDDGAFYFPYILDPQSTTALLAGTCRVWRGPRLGGIFTALSPNFDTLGSGVCSGGEVNVVRALAAGGPSDSSGSQVIYAATDGPGPLVASSPAGGNVWVMTNDTTEAPAFTEVTGNINSNQFPVSSVAIDTADTSGKTAYVTIMGFTGGPGHVWKTTNAGGSWADFTADLPDAPVNTVVIDSAAHIVYVGTDVGVFQSSTAAPSWTEVGPSPSTGQAGFLPNVAVTALAIFNSAGQKLLRASTYGRGIWQYSLLPTFQIAITNSPQTIFPSQTATFNGTITAIAGYTSNITLSCASGTTAPPATCTPNPLVLTATTNTPFTITAGGAVGDYMFEALATGSDPNSTTRQAPLALHVVNFSLTTVSPNSTTLVAGSTSSPVSFQVTAAGSFDQAVNLSCTVNIPDGTCALAPGNTAYPTASAPATMTAIVTAPSGASLGTYTATVQATSAGAPSAQSTTFNLTVVTQDFTITSSTSTQNITPGRTTSPYDLTIAPAGSSFTNAVSLACAGLPSGAQCNFSQNPVTPGSSPVPVALTISTSSSTPLGSSSVTVTAISGSLSHSVIFGLTVNPNSFQLVTAQDFPANVDAGSQATATIIVTPNYAGKFTINCDATSFSGTCSVAPPSPLSISAGTATTLTLTVNVPNTAAPNPSNKYNVRVTVADISGQPNQIQNLSLTVIQDFNLSSSTASQTISAGQSTGPYNLTINPVGAAFANAVTLSCSGLPPLAQCSFNPSGPITPGSTPINVVMTISTTATTSRSQWLLRSVLYALWMMLPGIALLSPTPAHRRYNRRFTAPLLMLLLVAFTISCGGGNASTTGGTGGGGNGHEGTKPGNYAVTVMGTSGSLVHNTAVTLIVQ